MFPKDEHLWKILHIFLSNYDAYSVILINLHVLRPNNFITDIFLYAHICTKIIRHFRWCIRYVSTSFLAFLVVIVYTCRRCVEKIPNGRRRILEIPTTIRFGQIARPHSTVAMETDDQSLQENKYTHTNIYI